MSISQDALIRRVNNFVVTRLSAEREIDRIRIFGSRARGDSDSRSDFDFAVEAPGMEPRHWLRLTAEIIDNAPTLCGIDLLRVTDTTPEALRRKIDEEGVTIFERKAA